jgi:hypothetical protein
MTAEPHTGDPTAGEHRLRADRVVWREVGDEVIVFDSDRSEYLATNPAGTVLWPLLAAGATLAELGRALSERWRLSPAQGAAAAAAFVAELRAQGLLED